MKKKKEKIGGRPKNKKKIGTWHPALNKSDS